MNDFLKLANNRVTTYDFSDKRVSDTSLKEILEACRLAPSLLNAQPWSFIVVRDSLVISQLINSAYYGDFHTMPNLVIVLAIDGNMIDDSFRGIKDSRMGLPEALLSMAMPALQMCLMATSLGIGSCLLTPNEFKIKPSLNVKKSDFIPLMIGLGYEVKGGFKKKKERKPLGDLVFSEKWGVKLF